MLAALGWAMVERAGVVLEVVRFVVGRRGDAAGNAVGVARQRRAVGGGRRYARDERGTAVGREETGPRIAAVLVLARAADVRVRVVRRAADLIERIGQPGGGVRGVGRVCGVVQGRRRRGGLGLTRGAGDAGREHGGAGERCGDKEDEAHRALTYHAEVVPSSRARSRSMTATMVLALALPSFSCSASPEVRTQALLVIDTDLPVAGAPGLVPVAAMDTLRIDVLDGATVRETRELVLGDPRDWPVSFGAVAEARLRLRLFRAAQATGSAGTGSGSLEPRPEMTVDRLVELAPRPGGSGVTRLRVLLTGDCLGISADLLGGKTCIMHDAFAGAPTDGVPADEGEPSLVGTWSRLTPVQCTPSAWPDRICVPGSFDVIGDLALAGNPNLEEAPVPLRPVVVSPFRMDRTEVTVRRVRRLLAGGWKPRASLPWMTDAADRAGCTFAGAVDLSADDLPLNCVTAAFARELCAKENGRLPTEAEWEHAARSGDGRPFPWGVAEPTCCTTSAGRSPDVRNRACGAGLARPEAVGSHLGAHCPSGGDVSREGIFDLGGSLVELTSDRFAMVVACGPPGLRIDPACDDGQSPFVVKSTDWTAGLGTTRAAFRSAATAGERKANAVQEGFRCVYPEPVVP